MDDPENPFGRQAKVFLQFVAHVALLTAVYGCVIAQQWLFTAMGQPPLFMRWVIFIGDAIAIVLVTYHSFVPPKDEP